MGHAALINKEREKKTDTHILITLHYKENPTQY